MNTACSPEVTVPDTATPSPVVIITATLPPTQTPRPSPTLEPPTATPVVVPAEGQTISQLNVRGAPSADSDLLGTVEISSKVQIVGKDPTSGWWLIVYPQSPTGTGWVTAQFVQATDTQNVPVIGAGSQAAGNNPATGVPPAAEAGPTVGAGGAAIPSPASDLTLATAYPDGDSAQTPAVSITLSKASLSSFNYSSDISIPEGDAEDWVQFKLDGQTGTQTIVSVILDCSGSSMLNVELIQNNTRLQGWDNIVCGHRSQLQLYLYAGSPYSLRLSPAQGNYTISYVAYTVIVQLF
ncbi:MAG: SH3 domain-containing protein [Anaerolineales bacterium]|nr:SH3 domain-containing protein [Anaerolineales bacterium]